MPVRKVRGVPGRRRDGLGVTVDIAREGVTVSVADTRIRDIVRAVCQRERVREGVISVTFVSARTIARMNREFLQHRGPTDIITFEFSDTNGVTMGDIYIAPEVARANARAHGVGIRQELIRLVIHGTLHVLGHTHPDDDRMASPMWRTQEAFVAALA